MAVKAKKKTTKKKVVKKSTGIASYTRKIQNAPAVKRVATTIKTLEAKLKAAKKKKAIAVKQTRNKLKK
jgi:hypothetical protein